MWFYMLHDLWLLSISFEAYCGLMGVDSFEGINAVSMWLYVLVCFLGRFSFLLC